MKQLVVLLPFSACAALAATIHVPADYSTIQDALDAAADGDEVVVSPGTYHEHWLNFQGSTAAGGVKNLTLRGEDPYDRSVVESTVIDGDYAGRVITFRSGESAGSSVLSGLTLTGGSAKSGGAMLFSSAAATVHHCIIRNNRTTASSEFSGGAGSFANADSHPVFDTCLFEANDAAGSGGAVYVEQGGATDLTGCDIRNNTCGQYGGGIELSVGCSMTLTNCALVGNSASQGNALDAYYFSDVVLDHCTITRNNGPAPAVLNINQSSVDAANSIVWGNSPPAIYAYNYGSFDAHHSDIEGGWPGTGNIDADPGFLVWDGYDLVLRPGSPAIDTASGPDDGIEWSTIHPGYALFNSQLPDMGAYGGPGNGAWLWYGGMHR